MLSASQVRRIRTKVMNELLAPRGFIQCGTKYVRDHGEQLHAIDFQAAMAGKEYTVNIGFHYGFIPGLFHREVRNAIDYKLLDFFLRGRLGSILFQRPVWWAYAKTTDACLNQLREVAIQSIRVLDRCSNDWSEPGTFLKLLPPDLLLTRVPIPGAEPDDVRGTTRPAVWDVLPGWYPKLFDLSFALCAIAMKPQRVKLAMKYAEIGGSLTRFDDDREAILALCRGKARKTSSRRT